MFRMRRFRLFLLIALLSLLSIWELSRLNSWDVQDLTNFGFRHDEVTDAKPKANHPPSTDYSSPIQPDSVNPQLQAEVLDVSSKTSVAALDDIPTSTEYSDGAGETITGEELLTKQSEIEDEFGQEGQGRFDVRPRPSGKPKAYWKQQTENFPVQKHIELPAGEPKHMPRIQYTFGSESSARKSDRIRKQTAIREAFKHAWTGYKKHAMGHDELRPVTNMTADTFNGWGATLVDSLDTLWIMDFKDEFEAALKQVRRIDFKTSSRKDIPLFETTIRYLGGLIAAFDISGGKEMILLDKAVELAEVLMGAFDTPNRMPIPFYYWPPSYASQPHRASTHIVMAELGSLAVEFTRLSQITKEPKYYDAIARVTDALQKWQPKTEFPGVWPVRLDASGCKKPGLVTLHDSSGALINEQSDYEIVESDPQLEEGLVKRQLDDFEGSGSEAATSKSSVDSLSEDLSDTAITDENDYDEDENATAYKVDCESQGLAYEPHSKVQTYSIGAMADSTYEYFPKEHALLGGLTEQYKTMYVDSVDTIRKHFLYRPMTTDDRDILFLTKYDIEPQAKKAFDRKRPIYEATHLGCFAGGMFALGSKMFDNPGDMSLAEKLTDGCVWAYESTSAGVMAEEFTLVPCEDILSCAWNETRWHEWLDPFREDRFKAVELYNEQQEALQIAILGEEHDTDRLGPDSKRKRQEVVVDDESDLLKPSTTLHAESDDEFYASTQPLFRPKVALSHKKYVDSRIAEERLPPGYVQFHSREYKLRPEAIESVFIMYRLTGDEKWREKGWKMFQAVEAATRTASGHATLKDVTSQLGELRDVMESFWLAETLKYFYLLFSEESLVSLDDWVLNTEAHPMKLPK